MLRRLQWSLVLGVWGAAIPAAAQESSAEFPEEPKPPATDPAPAAATPAPEEEETAPEQPAGKSSVEGRASAEVSTPAAAAPEPSEAKPGEKKSDWETFLSGYFRAPMAIGISNRAHPAQANAPTEAQYSYGPTRTVDSNYYSFAYTRLQEQDWVELFVHGKKKHVEAVVGWMGYWLSSVSFRNPDAAWVPGVAYLTLDTDFDAGSLKPNVALTAGAWWPKFGYFEKYDTFTLGQFRQLGEQVRLKVPVNQDLTVTLVQGFGTGRDGSYNPQAPPPYQSIVGLDLLHYEHVQVAYKELIDVGLHFNYQWTRDPHLHQQERTSRSYSDAREAKFSTMGAEVNLKVPYAGRFWVSPSLTRIRNGWALGGTGTEVMHSIGGVGYATNYLAYDNEPTIANGTGSSLNFGFLYENKLSEVLGKPGEVRPEVTLNVFGLYIDAKNDLPHGSILTQDRLKEMKYGADVTAQVTDWLGVMLRWDEVNMDLDNSGYVFSAISPRLTLSSHFLSGESIYLQYSHYRYGENMTIAGTWPWGTTIIPGATPTQGGPYTGHKPDMDVIRLQATVKF
jgi:hypothetical protein